MSSASETSYKLHTKHSPESKYQLCLLCLRPQGQATARIVGLLQDFLDAHSPRIYKSPPLRGLRSPLGRKTQRACSH